MGRCRQLKTSDCEEKEKKENAVGEGRVFGLFVYCLFLVLYHTFCFREGRRACFPAGRRDTVERR